MVMVEMGMSTTKSDDLVIDIERRLTQVPKKINADHQQFSIYRVPAHIRKNNECYYEPRLVSIGPYHRNKEHLRAMEDYKWCYLKEFINQKDGILSDCIREIRNSEADIRACYFESVGLEEGNQFVEMMLLDSCFIIQLFNKWRSNEPNAACDAGWASPLLFGDLLMLENQIPFVVLEIMFNLYTFGRVDPPDEENQRSFLMLAANTLHDETHKKNQEESVKVPKPGIHIKHLLHLFYLLFVPTPEYQLTPIKISAERKGKEPHMNYFLQLLKKCDPLGFFKSKKLNENDRSPRVIKSAIELEEFGVKIKKKEKFKSFLDVSFKDGILEVPCFIIEEYSRSWYLNLIAFEQCSDVDVGHVEKPLSGYAVFMACLINMSVDVIVLERVGILENNLANSKEGAKFFRQLRECINIDFHKHYLKQVFVEVNDHCQAFWPKHRADLIRNYFSSPWTIFSLMAALLVLSLTIFSTICLVLTTFYNKN